MKPTARRVLILMIGAGILACSDSTEAVDQAYVTIVSGSPVVLRGEQLELSARLWTRTSL
jgi:hypothetical protein